MKNLLVLLALVTSCAFAQTNCSIGPCSGLGAPTGQCRTNWKYTQIDGSGNTAALWICGGIPPAWQLSGGGDSTEPTGTGFVHVTNGALDAAAVAQVNLATQITGTLPVSHGGAGGTTQSTALAALGIYRCTTALFAAGQSTGTCTATGATTAATICVASAGNQAGAQEMAAGNGVWASVTAANTITFNTVTGASVTGVTLSAICMVP